MTQSSRCRRTLPARDGFAHAGGMGAAQRTWMCWPCRTEAWGGAGGSVCAPSRPLRAWRGRSRHSNRSSWRRGPQDVAEARKLARRQGRDLRSGARRFLGARYRADFSCRVRRARAALRGSSTPGATNIIRYADDAAFRDACSRRPADAQIYRAPLVCEGGAIHVDGEGTLLTTEQCLLNPNRNPTLTRQEIEASLSAFHRRAAQFSGWARAFSDEETDGHVDNIACFVAPGRVICWACRRMRSHPDFEPAVEASAGSERSRDARGRALEVIELVQPQNRARRLARPAACGELCQFLSREWRSGDAGFRRSAGRRCAGGACGLFSGPEIVQVETLDIVQGGGGIHCITQQEPA